MKRPPTTSTSGIRRLAFRILAICALGLGIAVAQMLVAKPETAHALPQIGWFIVNSSADTNFADSFLTLREAILVANGTLTGTFTAGEQSQLTGCSFDGSGNITGGCGAGIADVITFSGTVTQVVLTSPLPALTDAGTLINGSGAGVPRINAASAAGNVFTINGNSISIYNLSIVNGFAGSNFADIYVQSGKGAIIAHNYLGTLPSATNCTPSGVTTKNDYGIYIAPNSSGASGANNAVAFIYDNTIGCFVQHGIYVSGADYVDIGTQENASSTSANYIGVTSGGNNIANGSDGVRLEANGSDGVRYSQIKRNTIQYNSGNGIALVGTGTNNTSSTYSNVIYWNTVLSNTLDGVALTNAAYLNFIGSGILITDANLISGNGQNGVRIDGSNNNSVISNTIGLTADDGTALANSIGVLLTNSSSNNSITGNYVSGNNQDGVQLINSAHHNTLTGNTIGKNSSNNARPNAWSGVAIFGGAHDNTIGDALGSSIQEVSNNSGYGVFISGSTTTTNTVISNYIWANGLDGITIQSNANHISMTLNSLAYNLSGIYLSSGAWANSIRGNLIGLNKYYGVILDGSGTQLNTISSYFGSGYISANGTVCTACDGIGERNGAGLNVWSQLQIYDNAGLGIDKNASSDSTNAIDGPFPVITSASLAGGTLTLNGTATANALVEVYATGTDPSGYGEGKSFIKSATANGSGNWTMSFPGSSVGCYTAFQTFLASSEFGPNSCRTFLPLVIR